MRNAPLFPPPWWCLRKAAWRAPIVLVDVRTPDEYRTGHKEGALNIPADEVEQRAPQLLPDKNAVILLYCRTGKRADKALETLRKMGYSHVENLHRFEM